MCSWIEPGWGGSFRPGRRFFQAPHDLIDGFPGLSNPAQITRFDAIVAGGTAELPQDPSTQGIGAGFPKNRAGQLGICFDIGERRGFVWMGNALQPVSDMDGLTRTIESLITDHTVVYGFLWRGEPSFLEAFAVPGIVKRGAAEAATFFRVFL